MRSHKLIISRYIYPKMHITLCICIYLWFYVSKNNDLFLCAYICVLMCILFLIISFIFLEEFLFFSFFLSFCFWYFLFFFSHLVMVSVPYFYHHSVSHDVQIFIILSQNESWSLFSVLMLHSWNWKHFLIWNGHRLLQFL